MNRYAARFVLGIAGLLLLVIGSAVMIDPIGFAASNGVTLPPVPNPLSEYRAPGGLLIVSGIIALIGMVRVSVTRSALALAALVYGSFGAARLAGVLLDGLPSSPLTQAMLVELVIGALCLVTLMISKPTRAESTQR